MTTRSVRGSVATLGPVLAVVVLLFGCGGGSGGARGPTPTPAPTASPTPTVLPNPFTIAAAIPAGMPVGIGWGGGRYLVAFSKLVDRAEPDLVGLRLAADGSASDDAPFLLSDLGATPFLSPKAASYGAPAVVFGASGFGVFFFGGADLMGVPGEAVAFTAVPPAGAPRRPAVELATELTFSRISTRLFTPIVGADAGQSYVGLYGRSSEGIGPNRFTGVEGNFVTASGGTLAAQGRLLLVVFDPTDQTTSLGAAAAGVASNGDVVLSAWVQTVTTIATQQSTTSLAGAFVAPGTDPVRISLGSAVADSGRTIVASDGADFLVVWTSPTASDPTHLTEIRGMRYRPGTGALDADGGFVIAGGAGAKALGGVAFGGGDYLVVWEEGSSVRGARVATDGAVGAPFTIDAGPAADLAVTSDGEQFLTVFTRPAGAGAVDLLGSFVAAE